MSGVPADIGSIRSRCAKWYYYFLTWQILSWTLSVFIAGGSAFVASGLGNPILQRIAALIVAVCAAIQTTIRPENQANSYREAWVILDLALDKLDNVPSEIIDALRSGEARIGDRQAVETKVASALSTHEISN